MSHFAVKKLWGLPCISHPARHQCSLRGPLKVAFRLFSSYLLHSESRLRFSFISVLLSPYFMRIQGQEKTIRKDFLRFFCFRKCNSPHRSWHQHVSPGGPTRPRRRHGERGRALGPLREQLWKSKAAQAGWKSVFWKSETSWNIMKYDGSCNHFPWRS